MDEFKKVIELVTTHVYNKSWKALDADDEIAVSIFTLAFVIFLAVKPELPEIKETTDV